MTVSHSKVLELLGKDISFTVCRSVPEEYRSIFPEFEDFTGQVKGVLIALNGNHEILIDEEFYLLSDITLN